MWGKLRRSLRNYEEVYEKVADSHVHLTDVKKINNLDVESIIISEEFVRIPGFYFLKVINEPNIDYLEEYKYFSGFVVEKEFDIKSYEFWRFLDELYKKIIFLHDIEFKHGIRSTDINEIVSSFPEIPFIISIREPIREIMKILPEDNLYFETSSILNHITELIDMEYNIVFGSNSTDSNDLSAVNKIKSLSIDSKKKAEILYGNFLKIVEKII